MSHQTGIKANEKLKKFFSSYLDLNVRVFKVSIENEELTLSHFETVKDSWNVDFDKLVPPLVEPAQPAYILYRLDTKNETTGYDWLLISWSPDDSAVRQKMLFASTKATLKQEFGSGQIKEEYHATSLDEVSLKSLERHRLTVKSPAPLTTREEELVELRKSETTGLTEISVDSRSQTLSGVSFPLLSDAMTAIEHFAQKKVNYAQFKIDDSLENLRPLYDSAPTFRTIVETDSLSTTVELKVTIPHSIQCSHPITVTCQTKPPKETFLDYLNGASYREEQVVALDHEEFSKLQSLCISTVNPFMSSSDCSKFLALCLDGTVNPNSDTTADRSGSSGSNFSSPVESEASSTSLSIDFSEQSSESSESLQPKKILAGNRKRTAETNSIAETSKKPKRTSAAVNQRLESAFEERLKARSRKTSSPNISTSISKLSDYVQQLKEDINNNIDYVQGTLILKSVLEDILALKAKNKSLPSEMHKVLLKSLRFLINTDEALINEERNFVSMDIYPLVMLSADAVFIILSSYSKELCHENTVVSQLVLFMYIHFFNSLLPVVQKSYNKADPLAEVNFNKVFGENSFRRFLNKFDEILSLLSKVPEIIAGANDSFSKLVAICTSSFFTPNIFNLQHSCLKLITSFFAIYKHKRDIIFDQIINTIALLNSEKSFIIQSYKINQSNLKIQFFTAALLLFVSSSGNYLRHASNADYIKDLHRVNMYDLRKLFHQFLNEMITRSTISSNFKSVLENFILDLLKIRCHPDWLACTFIFQYLFKLIMFYVSKESSKKPLLNAVFDIFQLCLPELRNDFLQCASNLNELRKIVSDEICGATPTSADLTNIINSDLVCGLKLVIRLLSKYKNSKSLIELYCISLVEEMELNIRKSKLNPKLKPVQKQSKEIFSFIHETVQSLHNCGNVSIEFKPIQLTPKDEKIVKTVHRCLNSSNLFISEYSLLLSIIYREGLDDNSQMQLKALNCIFSIVDIDPSLLFFKYIEMTVSKALNHIKASIREKTIDFLTEHIFTNEDIFNKYFEKKALADGIYDVSVSVKKATLKIYCKLIKDKPDYPKMSDVIVKLLRKLNDEPAIVKTVVEIFRLKWIDKLNKTKNNSVAPIILEILSVLKLSKEVNGAHLFKKLFNLFADDTDSKLKIEDCISACKKISKCILNELLTQDILDAESSVNCYHLLLIIVLTKPVIASILCEDLYPHLSAKLKIDEKPQILELVLTTLKLLILSQKSFFEGKEKKVSLLKSLIPIFESGNAIVTVKSVICFCLISKINNDYSKAIELFLIHRKHVHRYYNNFIKVSSEEKYDLSEAQFRRALFNLAALIKYLNFARIYDQSKVSSTVKVIEYLLLNDSKNRSDILLSFALISCRFETLLLKENIISLLSGILQELNCPLQMKFRVLCMINSFLVETNNKSKVQNDNWSKISKIENLKEMNDVSAGIPSVVAQRYLPSILSCYSTSNKDLRINVVKTLSTIVKLSLVHPKNFLSYCICMLADPECVVSETAIKMLTDIQSTQLNLFRPHCLDGVLISVKLELMSSDGVLRGFSLIKNKPVSRFYKLFKLSSQIKDQHNLVASFLSQFSDNDHKVLLFLADNLAHFPYKEIKDVLSLLMKINTIICNNASPLFEKIQEVLAEYRKRKRGPVLNEKNKSAKKQKKPSTDNFGLSLEELLQLCKMGYTQILLLHLWHFLKSSYKISDNLLTHHLTQSSSKLKKAAIRKSDVECFNPESVIYYLKSEFTISSQNKENLGGKPLFSTLKTLNSEFEKLSSKLHTENLSEL